MEFQKSVCACLKTALREVRDLEQTQEIRLGDGLPDVGRILAAWGQVILRGKEWSGDRITVTAGVMVWVLYAPEDGTGVRCVEGWIPLRMQWELPEDPEEIRAECLVRFVDARSLSARKIQVRAGVGALAEAFVPMEAETMLPGDLPEGVELRKVQYPLRLPREAGEKNFLLEEDLTLPGSAPEMDRILYYTLTPELAEQRVLTDKAVFRGTGNLHILYLTREGQVQSWDFALGFSQYADLTMSHGGEASIGVQLAVTGLELEKGEGSLHLKCTLTGQYLIDDLELLEVVEDAYCPGRSLELETRELELPVVLETRQERIPAEQTVAAEGTLAADVQFLPDFPRQRRTENGVTMELPGTFQILYYGADGELQSAASRWEGEYSLRADEACCVGAAPQVTAAEPQILLGSGDMKVRGELPLVLTTTSARGLPMVTGLTLGEEQAPDANRPSLILRRAGDRGLWDLAKASGSTVEAIRRANGLQEDPAPGQMLLIPIL